ncbi:MAG: hypothetical protein KJ622_13545 [Alphaproteobacteria bacterium]|nr:hypothetical protein [Alphaproteobacteria bacterium]
MSVPDNQRRAARASIALAAYRTATGTEPDDALCDLLADLMHWANQHGFDFAGDYDMARCHFDAEVLEPDSFDLFDGGAL